MIPDEAVQAALSSIEHLPTVTDESRRRTVRAILEAAGPVLMARAWDEGYDEAEHEPIYNHRPTNPYRQDAEQVEAQVKEIVQEVAMTVDYTERLHDAVQKIMAVTLGKGLSK